VVSKRARNILQIVKDMHRFERDFSTLVARCDFDLFPGSKTALCLGGRSEKPDA